jgi:hypothetical protein
MVGRDIGETPSGFTTTILFARLAVCWGPNALKRQVEGFKWQVAGVGAAQDERYGVFGYEHETERLGNFYELKRMSF